MYVDVDSSDEAGASTVVWPVTGGTRGGVLILGKIGREREDGGAATVAGGERDIVPTPGKTTGEIDSDTAVVAGCEGDRTSIPGETTGE